MEKINSNEIQKVNEALKYVKSFVEKIANKNLKEHIDFNRFPSEKALLESIEKMRLNLAELISEIMQNSENLKSSSSELNHLSSGLLKSAKNTTNKAIHVAENTNMMSENMTTISAAAEELSINMNTVSTRAEESSQNIVNVSAAVEEMSATIGEVANHSEKARFVVASAVESVKKATESMDELSKAAHGIGYVTTTISGISDQTKLLALNATIEASRAGKAGTRFGVVASEVKALAGQTNQATQDIQEKVESMQEAVKSSLAEIQKINKVMEDVNNIVSTIATAVEEQSATTKEISSNINYAADGINDMSLAVGEANFAVQEVTQNITQAARLASDVSDDINEVSRDSKNMTDNSTVLYAGALEVSSRAIDLERVVELFKIPDNMKVTSKNMELFKFTEHYSVKVNDLDHEHQGIFNYINTIHKKIKGKATAKEVLPILKDLYQWTDRHFAHEEKLMLQVKYHDYDKQKAAHTKLLNDVKNNISKIERNEDIDLIELMIFLKEWLVGHILGMDKKYSEPMISNGIN